MWLLCFLVILSFYIAHNILLQGFGQKMSCFRKPDRPLLLPPTLNFFRHNLHSVKIGNLCSISQVPFRLHSIVLVQGQHDKTGVQVNHVFLSKVCTVVDCTGILGNVKILSLAVLNSSNIKVSSAIQYLQLFILKSQIEESIISPAVYEHKITPKYGEKQPLFVCKQTHGFI